MIHLKTKVLFFVKIGYGSLFSFLGLCVPVFLHSGGYISTFRELPDWTLSC